MILLKNMFRVEVYLDYFKITFGLSFLFWRDPVCSADSGGRKALLDCTLDISKFAFKVSIKIFRDKSKLTVARLKVRILSDNPPTSLSGICLNIINIFATATISTVRVANKLLFIKSFLFRLFLRSLYADQHQSYSSGLRQSARASKVCFEDGTVGSRREERAVQSARF